MGTDGNETSYKLQSDKCFMMIYASVFMIQIISIIYNRKYEEEHRITKNSHYNMIMQ